MPLAAPVTNAVRPVRSYAVRGMRGRYEPDLTDRQLVVVDSLSGHGARDVRGCRGVRPGWRSASRPGMSGSRARARWQAGHQYVTRSPEPSPCSPCGSAVPQRRQGRPPGRRRTAGGRACRRGPVVTAAGRPWLASRSFLARSRGRWREPGGRSGRSPTGSQGVTRSEEAELALVDIADPGEIALVEEGLAEGAGRGARGGWPGPCPGPSRGRGDRGRGGRRLGSRRRCAAAPGRGGGSRRPCAVGGAEDRPGSGGAGPPLQRSPGAYTFQAPSIRRCECRVRPPSKRVRRCLPRGVTSRTVRPVRSAVANCGTRRSERVSTWPARAVCSRFAASQTVSPSGMDP